jgi:hypothetical protein
VALVREAGKFCDVAQGVARLGKHAAHELHAQARDIVPDRTAPKTPERSAEMGRIDGQLSRDRVQIDRRRRALAQQFVDRREPIRLAVGIDVRIGKVDA